MTMLSINSLIKTMEYSSTYSDDDDDLFLFIFRVVGTDDMKSDLLNSKNKECTSFDAWFTYVDIC